MRKVQLESEHEERDARLREIERELDSDLGIDEEVAIGTVVEPKKQLTIGKIVIGVVGALIAWVVLKWVLRLAVGLVFTVGIPLLIILGIFWLVGQLRKR